MEPRKYYYNNSTLTIIFDDILHSKTEVIVSSDDTAVDMVGGLSGAIRKVDGTIILYLHHISYSLCYTTYT